MPLVRMLYPCRNPAVPVEEYCILCLMGASDYSVG